MAQDAPLEPYSQSPLTRQQLDKLADALSAGNVPFRRLDAHQKRITFRLSQRFPKIPRALVAIQRGLEILRNHHHARRRVRFLPPPIRFRRLNLGPASLSQPTRDFKRRNLVDIALGPNATFSSRREALQEMRVAEGFSLSVNPAKT